MEELTKDHRDPLKFLKELPWEKIAIWAVFALGTYLLRSFFSILFVTFIICYITSSLVSMICIKAGFSQAGTTSRNLVTIVIFLILITLITGTSYFVFPRLVLQVRYFVSSLQGFLPEVDIQDVGEPQEGLMTEDDLQQIIDIPPKPPAAKSGGFDLRDHFEDFLEDILGEERFALLKETPEYELAVKKLTRLISEFISESFPILFKRIPSVFMIIFHATMNFFLSILLSFIIVLQLPSLKKNFSTLRHSRLSRFYDEIAPDIVEFGKTIGKAFQAQIFIAICNTIVTFVGMLFLGIPSPLVLSIIVFICSFIPVLGVFMSSVPICLLGLQQGGFILMSECILLIVIVHLSEAYLLNPKIIGSVMKLHSLTIIIILLVAGNLFGLWGLLLGVPTYHYIFNTLIMKKTQDGPSPYLEESVS